MSNSWNSSPSRASAILQSYASPFVEAAAPGPWHYVRRRFRALHSNLLLTQDQRDDGKTKYRGVVSALNRHYWGTNNHTTHRELVGSWGKKTRVRPPRDIDLIFELPVSVHERFEQRTGNKQSQLLQEVRDVLSSTYSQTSIRGDGQVVVVPFNTFAIEVAPGFPANGGGYVICDTNNGGRYKWVHPGAELDDFNESNGRHNGNVRKLSRMLKQWQRHCSVPLKSFQIEAIVKEALLLEFYGGGDEFWFDWLVRDVLAHLIGRANGHFFMPVTGEMILLGDAWLSRAETAHARAVKACSYEHNNQDSLAGDEWQKIFGTMIPRTAG